jgi:hypothetical protein
MFITLPGILIFPGIPKPGIPKFPGSPKFPGILIFPGIFTLLGNPKLPGAGT